MFHFDVIVYFVREFGWLSDFRVVLLTIVSGLFWLG